MQLQELKDQIIDQLSEVYDLRSDLEHFTAAINECKDGFELLRALSQYGYDMQGGLHILFSILIK